MRETAAILALATGSLGWLMGWGMIVLSFGLLFSSESDVGLGIMIIGLGMRWLGRRPYRSGARLC